MGSAQTSPTRSSLTFCSTTGRSEGLQKTESSTLSKKKTPLVNGVPSFKEVIESSQTRSTPPSLFNPSQSFSQAFSFIKNSEFYAPPPVPDVPASRTPDPRSNAESSEPSLSGSFASSTVSTAVVASLFSQSNSAQSWNAILVRHRQLTDHDDSKKEKDQNDAYDEWFYDDWMSELMKKLEEAVIRSTE